jgi:hypothetical protein
VNALSRMHDAFWNAYGSNSGWRGFPSRLPVFESASASFSSFWHPPLTRRCRAGDSSRIASAVQQAGAAMPAEAHTTAELLHASRTWLRHSHAHAVAATIPTLSPPDTVWCFLAMHTPFPAPTTQQSSADAAAALVLPWSWIHASTVAVSRTRYTQNKKLIQGRLRKRIEMMSPTVRTSMRSTTDGAARRRGRGPAHATSRELRRLPTQLQWPEHAPALLAGLHMPIPPSQQRSALRPMLSATAACIAESRRHGEGFSPRVTQSGHWIGVLDLVSTSLAAMSHHHHRIAAGLVATACEELQAQVSVLPAHHVACSALLLGEILTKQVRSCPALPLASTPARSSAMSSD